MVTDRTVNVGNPQVISPTQGEDITPDNPEVVQDFPVDITNQAAVDAVESPVDRSQRSHEWLDRNPE